MVGYFISIFAVLVGYLVTVALTLGGTMALTSVAPRFVVSDYRLRTPYKLAYLAIWFVCVLFGAIAAAWSGSLANPREQELLLILVLLFVSWRNTWEARQRGTFHQVLLTLATVVAVVLGFLLEPRLLPPIA